MNILVVDPGPTTGLASWYARRHTAWAEPMEQAMSTVHGLLASASTPLDLLIFEDFVISAGTLKKTREGSKDAIEFIGVGRYLCRCYGVKFVTQLPGDKAIGTTAKFKALGWKTPGPGDHARSASGHLLKYLIDNRLIDLAALAAALG